jgi:hypothetical protein
MKRILNLKTLTDTGTKKGELTKTSKLVVWIVNLSKTLDEENSIELND